MFFNKGVEGFMNLGLKTGLLGGACALALAAFGVPAYAQDDITTLRQQLEAMKERLAKLEADKQEKRRVAAAAAVEAGDKPRSWKLPGTNTSMNIGGFVKFTANYGFAGFRSGGSGHDASAFYGLHNPAGSVIENQHNGGHLSMTARRSRFWIQTWTPTDWGELRTYIEGDFADATGGADVLRLRHAYGTLGPVLAGQTWSTWYHPFSWPEALDDGGFPLAAHGVARRAQVRYTHNFGGGLTMDFALESPVRPGSANFSDHIVGGAAAAQRWPNVVVALEIVQPTFRARIAGLLQQIEHDTGTGNNDDTEIGWGFSGGISWTTPIPRLTIGASGFFGRGIGNVAGYADAVLVHANKINGVWAWGGMVHAGYGITDTIRVNGGFGYHGQRCKQAGNQGLNAAGVILAEAACAAGGTIVTGAGGNWSDEWMAFGNLLWNPVPQVTFGVEYIHGFSNRYQSNNVSISRLQFAAIYRF
jgi:hypothetical protein